jgi:putative hydrolase of the HAD superfamily
VKGRERPTALLVDLDGVLRQWDPAVAADAERRHGLPAGALAETARRWSRRQPAVTGQLGHADWLAGVVDDLAERVGDRERARAAVDEWESYPGTVDTDVLAFVRKLRAAGIRVGLAANGTDALDAELATLRLTGEVDLVINSAVLGVHKPTKEYFRQACAALGVPPQRVLFVDDDDRCVRGARVAGLSAYRWNGPRDLPYLRAALTG